MAHSAAYTGKHVLIVDDMHEMRSSLRGQIASLAIEKVSLAGTVRDALEFIKKQRFDIILCDYNLGDVTDGQQFLEYLRTTRIISRATLFIMITAETRYEKVITAAECLPDDYLLKPFTAETLKSRFERLLDKKVRLAAIDKLQDQGRWSEIISACDEIIASSDKYLIDAMRIKGNALIMTRQFKEAGDFYRQALALRPLPWAKLGLARAQRSLGKHDEAKELLGEIVDENPNFLSAYDMLGHIHMEEGNSQKALEILDRACTVSPKSLARHRSIAGIAEDAGDLRRVEQALSVVVKQTRNSPLRSSADYAKLGNALSELGEAKKAVELIREARNSFREAADTRLLAAVEAVAQNRVGNADLAKQAMDRALLGDTTRLPEATALALAKACLVNDQQDQATAILRQLVQNHPDAAAVHARVTNILKDHGGEEASQRFIELSVREVIDLNNEAVAKAKAREFTVASTMLMEAAGRLPNNLQIVANASYCLLLEVFQNGVDEGKLDQARLLLQSVRDQDASYAKLADIEDVLALIRGKYGSQVAG